MSRKSYYCSVPQCKSINQKNNSSLAFHHFPKAGKYRVAVPNKVGNSEFMDVREAWINKLRIGKPVSKFMKICSLHFKEDDYFPRDTNSQIKRRNLKRTSVPSLNLPRDDFSLPSNNMIVTGCNSSYKSISTDKNDNPITFHSFPRSNVRRVTIQNSDGNAEVVDRRWAWIQALKMGSVTSSTRICSQHFKEEDFFFPSGQPKSRGPSDPRRVNSHAVPSQNLPQDSKMNEVSTSKSEIPLKDTKAENTPLEEIEDNDKYKEFDVLLNSTLSVFNNISAASETCLNQTKETTSDKDIELNLAKNIFGLENTIRDIKEQLVGSLLHSSIMEKNHTDSLETQHDTNFSRTKFKSCFVPACINNARNSNKLFIHVPSQRDMSIRWFKAVGRPYKKDRRSYYCCEDHFVLQDDCENWMAFKMFRSRMIMKKDVVPHRNLAPQSVNQHESQLSEADKMIKLETLQNYAINMELEQGVLPSLSLFDSISSCPQMSSNVLMEQTKEDEKVKSLKTENANLTKEVQFLKSKIAKLEQLVKLRETMPPESTLSFEPGAQTIIYNPTNNPTTILLVTNDN